MAVTTRRRSLAAGASSKASNNTSSKNNQKKAEVEVVPAWRKAAGALLRAVVIIVLFRTVRFVLKYKSAAVDTADPTEMYSPAWKVGEPAKLYIYLSEQVIQTRFVQSELFHERSFIYGQPMMTEQDDQITITDIPKPKDRLYAHLYLCRNAVHPDPDKSGFRPLDVAYKRVSLMSVAVPETDPIKWGATGEQTTNDELYWYPKLSVSVVALTDVIKDITQTPQQYRPHMSIDRSTRHYLPIMYTMEHWQLQRNRIFLNKLSNSDKLSLSITVQSRPVWWFKLMSTVGLSIHTAQQMNAFLADEYEQFKELLTETATWLLVCTVTVSILHSLFDVLAFKNDVQFWRKRNNLTGLSVRSVFINILSQLVITIYLLEQRASWLVIVSAVAGVVIEAWKASKVVRWDGQERSFKSLQGDTETERFDKEAISLLTKLVVPLMVAYSAYSFMNHKHKNLWSFAIQTAVGFVYAFGFVLMTPQLYVNYKLKSVAHLPWRVFCYKALNTVVDDLFAFAIKMPWMHRLSCFRDDLIFLVYLYQRWSYPVDKTRVNEYGQSFTDDAAALSFQ